MRILARLLTALAVLAALVPPSSAAAAGPGSTSIVTSTHPPTGVHAPAPGRGAKSFTFYGSGWGHGVGMSQYGSYGLAAKGWKYQRILKRFYAGTTIGNAPNPVAPLRVGLGYDRSTFHVRAERAQVSLRVGSAGGQQIGRIPIGKTWEIRVAGAGFAIVNHQGKRIGGSGKTWGSRSKPVVAVSAPSGARPVVTEKGYGYPHGVLEFGLYQRSGTWYQRLVLSIGMEDYLKGIAEIPASWPQQALRAQIVAARSFATYQARNYGRRSTCDCHVLDGIGDQTYHGDQQETQPTYGKAWVNAVEATRGKVILSKGKPILAVYSASDGGHTDSVADAWHGGDQSVMQYYPYLDAACDPGEFVASQRLSYYSYLNWSSPSYSGATLAARFGLGIGSVTGFGSARRGKGGRIISVVVQGSQGKKSMSGSSLRSVLALRDSRVWVNSNENIVGDIRRVYDDAMCAPGLPKTARRKVPGGAWQGFKQGAIYRNDRADLTVWLKGPVFEEYRRRGGPTGSLGLPETPIRKEAGVKRARFQHGTIRCTGGTCAVI
jgi:SpoIID/LytB domain protein